MPAGTDPSTYTITIDPRDIPAGNTAVVAVSQTALLSAAQIAHAKRR